MCQFEHEGKKIKLLPREPKAEPSEAKPAALKKTNNISLITAKPNRQDMEQRALRDPRNQESYQGNQHSDPSLQ